MLKKIGKEKKYFLHWATTTAWATHKNSETKSKLHVPWYMDLKKYQNSMYPGTWIWRKSKISCTRVHELTWIWRKNKILFTRIHESEKKILMCSSGSGGGPAQKKIFFLPFFFNMWKKQSNFGNFVKIKVSKFKLNHLG